MEKIIRERAIKAARHLKRSMNEAQEAKNILDDLGFSITASDVDSIIRDTKDSIEFLQEVVNNE